MITSIDVKIGKLLFIPIIIKICQLFNWNQFQFYRYGYALAAMLLFPYGWKTGSWIIIAMLGFFIFIFVLSAIVQNDKPSPAASSLWRLLTIVIFVSLDAIPFLMGMEEFDISIFSIPLMTFAEYAKVIDRLPPREIKQSRKASVPVQVRN